MWNGTKWKGTMVSHLNHAEDKTLSRFGREYVITDEFYKDEQPKQVYEMIDQVAFCWALDKDTVVKTKFMFHAFRDKMNRIHNLEMAVSCLLILNL